MMVDERFVFRVADYMPSKHSSNNSLDDDRAEKFHELDFITGGFKCC